MTLKLTDEQRQALQQQETPLRLVDEQTNTVYVLIRQDEYERVRGLFEDEEFDPRETYPFIEEIMREDDENDPALQSYQDPNYGKEAP